MNVVLIVVDSLRQDHLGAYGNDWIRTPCFDKFAAESVRYNGCHPEALPTLPMRRSLYTGKPIFPFPEIATDFSMFYQFPGWGPIRPDRQTVSEVFMKDGYRTCLIADLWHMFKTHRNFHRGFSSYEFVRGQEADNFRTAPALEDELIERFIPESHRKNEKVKRFIGQYLMNNLYVPEEERSMAQVFRKASRWVQENQDAENFFLVVESFDPHEPWFPPQYYRRMYDPDEDCPTQCIQPPYMKWQEWLTPRELKRLQANYAGVVSMLDRWFGYFMEGLRCSGRQEDTVVALITDHGHMIGYPGDQDYVGKHGHPSTRGVNDLALMIRHPEGVGAGKVSDLLCQNYDLTTTLIEMAGLDKPADMDGLNIWEPALKGERLRDFTTTVWGTVATVVTDQWWYNSNVWGEGKRLFDRAKDPLHAQDLAREKPEICEELLERVMETAGGKDKLPPNLATFKDRVGCGLNGYAPMAYSNAIYIDAATF